MTPDVSSVWAPGETVCQRYFGPRGHAEPYRNVFPLRVLSDDGHQLLGWLPQDTVTVHGVLASGEEIRSAPMEQRFRIPRIRKLAPWHGTSTLRLIPEGTLSSVWWFFDAAGVFAGWYVNLELPLGRSADGVDRIDGVLDLIVSPDGAPRWKDEDEAEAAVDAGRITASQLVDLRAEGERMWALAAARRFPFDDTHTTFAPDPSWPKPELPERIRSEVALQ